MFGLGKRDTIILQAEEIDLPRIGELHAASFSRGWSQSELLAQFAQPGMLFLVARTVGKPKEPILGFNLVRQTTFEAEIISVAVDPKHRGQEVGDALMREAISRLAGDRVPVLFLEVDENNTPAIALYRKLGFKVVGNRPGYYTSKDAHGAEQKTSALVMRLDLD